MPTDTAPARPVSARTSSRRGARTRRFRRVARTGFAVNGVIHVLIGLIAIGVALGDKSDRTLDQTGALAGFASTSGGRVLLWAAIVGLVTLGVWQITQALLADEPSPWRRWGRRVVEGAKGLTYLAIGSTVVVLALGGSTSSSASVRAITDSLLTARWGQLALIAIGLAFFGAGVTFVVIGIRRGFRKLIRLPKGRFRIVVLIFGAVGYMAEGVVLMLVGLVAVAAVLSGRTKGSFGLDGALRSLAALPDGDIFLGLVGGGLILYGAFLVARTKYARL